MNDTASKHLGMMVRNDTRTEPHATINGRHFKSKERNTVFEYVDNVNNRHLRTCISKSFRACSSIDKTHWNGDNKHNSRTRVMMNVGEGRSMNESLRIEGINA